MGSQMVDERVTLLRWATSGLWWLLPWALWWLPPRALRWLPPQSLSN